MSILKTTYNKERKFQCECGKSFHTRQRLKVHQRSHNADRPFTCDQCQKSFTTSGNLKNHQRLHTGDKPFTCTVNGCGKSFTEDSSLKKHMLTHSGEKPYKCCICNKGFTQSSSRSYHMKTKHPDHDSQKSTTSSAATCTQTLIVSSNSELNNGVT